MTKFYDISLTLSPNLPVWPGDPQVRIERVYKLENGDIANVTHFEGGAHSGTHVDAPFHFQQEGKTIDQIPIDYLIGEAQVLEIDQSIKLITKEVLETIGIQPHVRKLLLKTSNSALWGEDSQIFHKEYVGLSPNGAKLLIDRGVQLVGIDYLSIAPFENQTQTHLVLLDANIIILEGLDLSDVPQGIYELICLPVKIGGADGAFARAVLKSLD